MMKHEARFQIRGTVTDCRDETYGESKRSSLTLRVQVSQDKTALFNLSVWDAELCRVAAACRGKHVLVLGRLTGGKNERGYFNVWLAADAIMVEPGTVHAAGASAPAPSPHRHAKANGYQPQAGGQQQAQQPKPEDPLPWEGEEGDDIPF